MATNKKKSSKSATLRLDSAFYPKHALEQAQLAYSKLATIEIQRKGKEHLVTFSKMATPVANKLPDEFANYALSCAVTAP